MSKELLCAIMLIIFFGVMVYVGFYSRKHAKDVNGFVLGGRGVGPWLTAFAFGTSYFSAVIFVGYAGQFGWNFGLASTWAGLGNAFIGSLLAWNVLGRRTRVMTQHLDAKTMPDFFGKRFESAPLKVAASVMTGAMMVSMAGMSVCAAPIVGDGNHAIEAVPVQKTVATDGHTYAPDTSFSFRVANGGEGTFEGNVVSAGVTGGLAADENAVFTPSGTTPLASYTVHGSLAVDGSVFTSPGVYHYLVTEVSGDYEGMDYDNSTYDVYLYVYNSNNGLYVGNAVSVKNGDKADLAFTNDYGAREDNDSTHDITVIKEVTGTMGNKASQEFQFAVSVDGGEGEWYQVLVKETADAAAVEYHVVSGAQATSYSIKHGGSIQVLGLSESDQYSIIEDDYSSLGYTTTNKSNIGTLTADGTTITVTNHKDAASPTGLVTTVVPYALMLGMAGSLGALFLRKKQRPEE